MEEILDNDDFIIHVINIKIRKLYFDNFELNVLMLKHFSTKYMTA